MSAHVHGSDIGDAWLKAMHALSAVSALGLVNLTVTITRPSHEDLGIRRVLEGYIAARRAERHADFIRSQSVHTVANTIFPVSLYRRGNPEQFFATAIAGQSGRGGKPTSWQPSGTYIGRLLQYPAADGRLVNQLQVALSRLSNGNYKDHYELSIESLPEDASESRNRTPLDDTSAAGVTAGAAIYLPGFDQRHRGGQCLSHISLTLIEGTLHMSALYRHQVYIEKAYGNFLGLARVLSFLAQESGNRTGELMVLATHADFGTTKRVAQALVAEADEAGREVVPIETVARPVGASWQDLELPAMAPSGG